MEAEELQKIEKSVSFIKLENEILQDNINFFRALISLAIANIYPNKITIGPDWGDFDPGSYCEITYDENHLPLSADFYSIQDEGLTGFEFEYFFEKKLIAKVKIAECNAYFSRVIIIDTINIKILSAEVC